MIQYHTYSLSLKEYIVAYLLSLSLMLLLGLIFFKLHPISILLLTLSLLYPKMLRRQKVIQRKEELKQQFEQSLHMISASLSSGHSIENALRLTLQDLTMMYPGKDVMMIQEYRYMLHQIDHGGSVEQAFMDFSRRAGIIEITQFAEVFSVAKRSGGNLVEIIRDTVFVISNTLRIQQEIQVMIAKKKWEAKTLNILPIGIIALLVYSSPEYMAPLYQGSGTLLMTVACLMLLGCMGISHKIMKIEV